MADDLVTLTIDGQEVSVPKGTLAIEAAGKINVDVPRFCYHPKLSTVGMCRMCLARVGMPKMDRDRNPVLKEDGTPEIAMLPKPMTLCTTVVSPGMVIYTETDEVKDMQEGVMEFLLANHPLDCPVCDKGGECMLQDQAMAYGTGDSRVKDLYHRKKDLAKDFPLSPLIALDQERCIQCARCTRFQDEIAHDHVLELFNRGSKVLIGTLSDPPFDSKFSGNTVDICPVGALTSRDFRFRARVWEIENYPTISMADGSGSNIFVGQRNETLDRIIPRTNESINECWISDLDRFGLAYVDKEERLTYPWVRRDGELKPATWDEALQTVLDKLKSTSPERVAAVGGPKLTNEAALAMANLFKNVVKTKNVDHEWRPTLQTPGVPSQSLFEDLEEADVVLLVGTNPNEELPILDLRLKKAASQRNATIINCNTTRTALDGLAEYRLRHNADTEVSLVNGFSRAVHQSWEGEPERSEHLNEVDDAGKEWLQTLAPYSTAKVAETVGINEELLREAGAAIAKSEKLFILAGKDLSEETLQALTNLALLKGRENELIVLHHDANVQGVRRAGLTPSEGGKNGEQILQAAAAGDVEVLYLVATNPLHDAKNGGQALEALKETPFVVTHSLFMNEVTEYADVVFPAASFLEQDGSTTNFYGKVQKLEQVFKPRERLDEQGQVLSACAPDWIVLTKLQIMLGLENAPMSTADWGESFNKLPELGGKSTFAVAEPTEPAAAPSEDAFRLVSGEVLYDGGDSFDHAGNLDLVVPEPYVKVHRKDARKLGLQDGDYVEVKGPQGSFQVFARVARDVKEGTIWMPWRLRDVRLNRLTNDVKSTFVTLSRCETPADAVPPVAIQ